MTRVPAAALAALVLVVSCDRPQPPPAAYPLQPDPALAQQLELQRSRRRFEADAAKLTAAEVDELEARLKRKPRDFDIRRTLRHFYETSGERVFGRDELNARRRAHVLWIVDFHPDHELATWGIPQQQDPAGYAEAKQLWLRQSRNAGATPNVIDHAARFFADAEPLATLGLLERARELDPEGRAIDPAGGGPDYWPRRFGELHARLAIGSTSPTGDPYMRRKLLGQLGAESEQDPGVLAAAGAALVRDAGDAAQRELGRKVLQRAIQLDPKRSDAARALRALEEDERVAKLLAVPEHDLSEADRLEALLVRAERAMTAGDRGQANARASEARGLAQQHASQPKAADAAYYGAVILALNALADGNRDAARRHMFAATALPSVPGVAPRASQLDVTLMHLMLDQGERESVAVFLERSAQFRDADRARLEADAAAIREGRMPRSYQEYLARRQ